MVSTRQKLTLMALSSGGGFQGQTLNYKLNPFKLQTSMVCQFILQLYCTKRDTETQLLRLVSVLRLRPPKPRASQDQVLSHLWLSLPSEGAVSQHVALTLANTDVT